MRTHLTARAGHDLAELQRLLDAREAVEDRVLPRPFSIRWSIALDVLHVREERILDELARLPSEAAA